MKVALVAMPFLDISMAPLAPGGLKAYLQKHGVPTDVHSLHLAFAERIGPAMYRGLARNESLWTEWFFAYHTFGRGGTGDLPYKWGDVAKLASFKDFARRSGYPEALKGLLEKEIPAFLDETLEEIDWAQYGLVGFSSTMLSHAGCLAFARRVKERFGVPVVFGGPNAFGEMGRTLLEGCPWIDYVVDGEGEAALLDLVRAIEDGSAKSRPRKPIRGRNVDISTLPLPDHSDFFALYERCKRMGPDRPIATVETSRGCWWGQSQHCTFCGIPDIELVFRGMPPEQAARVIWETHERYGTGRIYAGDLIMGVEHQHKMLPELARLRREHDVDLRIFYESKSNLTREQIALYSAAGIAETQAGIESLSTPGLKRMRKGVRAIQNLQTLKWARGYNVTIIWNYLVGFPGEDPAEHADALEAVLAATHLDPPAGAGPLRPDRFSPYHENPKAFGVTVRPDPIYAYCYPEKSLPNAKVGYHFAFGKGDVPSLADPRTRALVEAASYWGRVWHQNFFASRRTARSVELFDTRPLKVDGTLQLRQHELTGLAAQAYRACESIRALSAIVEECRKVFPSCTQAEVSAELDSMVRQKWVWREDNDYLALAVPVGALTPTQRVLFDAFQNAGRKLAAPSFLGRLPLT